MGRAETTETSSLCSSIPSQSRTEPGHLLPDHLRQFYLRAGGVIRVAVIETYLRGHSAVRWRRHGPLARERKIMVMDSPFCITLLAQVEHKPNEIVMKYCCATIAL
jgi:hypothetical protein